jgi:hypothetical protein
MVLLLATFTVNVPRSPEIDKQRVLSQRGRLESEA